MEGSTPPQTVDETRPKRRRLPGVNLRPGSVKQARLEAGLSLAQLGRGHVTAPAIYLIETGRTRPSLPTLEHISRRTGKPVEFFMAEPVKMADDDHVRFLELEVMVLDHRDAEAIALGQSLLERSPSAPRRGRIRYLLALAYHASGQREMAARLLAEARQHFEAVNDQEMIVASLGAEAEFTVGTKPGEAVALAEAALAAARAQSPGPLIIAAQLRGVLADARLADGGVDQAIESYKDAIKFTEPVFDLRRAARTYGSLACALHEAGELEAAARYAMRATTLFELIGGQEAVVRWEQRLAHALSMRGDAAEARRHLDRGLELVDRANLDTGRTELLLAHAELSLSEGDVDRAAQLTEDALAAAKRLQDCAGAAEARVWLGRIADRRGDNDGADREFESAIREFESLGLSDRLLHAHGVYAEVLERRGDLAKAYGHMKRALRVSRPSAVQRDEEEKATTA